MGSIKPIIGTHYDTKPGESMEVIAVGTRGVVVEYVDGRVELLDPDCWKSLQHGSNKRLTIENIQTL